MNPRHHFAAFLITLLVGCSSGLNAPLSAGHLTAKQTVASSDIPPIVADSMLEPLNDGLMSEAKYSLTVHDVPVRDLIFALARDAGIDVDIGNDIAGQISLIAQAQTLPALLRRIARHSALVIELEQKTLVIRRDHAHTRHYPVDYVNLARKINGNIASNMLIGPAASGSNDPSAGNQSNTRIESSSRHDFWQRLERDLQLLISGTAPASALDEDDRSPAPARPTLTVNAESGLISLHARRAVHQQVQDYLDHLLDAARRQVLIEATIVEVSLAEGHEQGIDWSGLLAGGLFEFAGNPLKNSVNLRYTRDDNPKALISLLDSFGHTRVLSSPRLSVLNNQTALLKVVENYVYFTVKADTTTTANVGTTVTYSTTPQTVSVGLVMGVTAQISANDTVTLNIRPTITSIGREVADPNPDLRKNGIENLVPMIRTREIESVLRVNNGQIAVLGGLMEDRSDYQTQRPSILGEIPLLGEALTNRNNRSRKTELVIFLRPVVIRDPSLQGDYASLAAHLPDRDFLRAPRHARPFANLQAP
jgi:general secretion pathway protein D